MNNEVTFSVKIVETDTPGLKTVTVDAKQLGNALDQVSDKSKKFNGHLLDLNQVTMSAQNLFSGLQQVTQQVKVLTDAYTTQEMAEVKLNTIMRQRMNATDADVESVKQLASAQQELGVIGDEVALSGTQQLATFVNQKGSIEQLMPAMNNLLAQQKGLNATQEDAVSIGNMMGKAMQGQVTMLQRVGITFTDAQASVLKYGTEEQRAAMLAQVITDNVGNMNAELAKTDAGKAKQLSNTIGDMKEKMGSLFSSIEPVLTGLSEIGMTVFAIVQVRNGIMGMVTAVKLGAVATAAHTAATRVCTAVQNTHKAAMISLTAATGSATVAATALTAVYTMGLSVAITGIVLLISKLCSGEDKAKKSTEEMSQAAQDAKQRQDELNGTMSSTRAELSIMTEKLKTFKGTKEQEKKLVQECNGKYGEAMGYYSSVADWYKVLVSNSQTYCAQMVNEARIRQLANQAATAEQDAHDIKYNEDGSTKKYSTKKNGSATYNALTGQYNVTTADSDRDQAADKYNKKLKEANGYQKQMNSLVNENINLSTKLHKEVKGTTQYESEGDIGKVGKVGGVGNGKKTGGGDDVKAAAGSYTALGDAISKAQKELDATAPTDTAKIARLTAQIQTSKAAQNSVRALQAEYAKPTSLTTLEDYDNEISRQQTLLKTAGDTERVTITANIAQLQRQKAEKERAAETAPIISEIKSYEELNDAINYYTERLNTADAAGREAAQTQLTLLTDMKDQWEEADAAANKPAGIENLNTLKALDAAIAYYNARMQTASASELTRKRSLLASISGISTSGAELGELNGLTGTELKIKLKAIGVEEIESKIRSLQKLSQSGMTDPKQKKEIQSQIQEWTKYEKQLKKNSVTFEDAYGSVRNVGNGISSLTKTLKGNGNAWEKVTGTVDAGIEVYNGIKKVITIMKSLGIITKAQTVADKMSATASTEKASASILAGTASAAATTASAAAATASGTEAAADTVSATAKVMKAHASIPWVGIAIAAGFTATMLAVIAASKSSVPKFADGGLAYGTTLGIFGEYSNAATNPEVVTPLDKLRDLIGGSDGGGKVEFKVKGRRLVGVLERESRRRARG